MAARLACIAALAALGALNREVTGLLIGLSLFAAYPRQWRYWLPIGAIIASIFIGLRVLIPAPPSMFSPAHVWQLNRTPWRWYGAIRAVGLIGPLFGLIGIALWQAPQRIQWRIAIVLIPYLLLVLVFGVWQETRLLMPVLILGLPLIRKDTL